MDGRAPAPPTQTPQPRRLALLRASAGGAALALLIAAAAEIYRVTFGGNVHEVIPGAVYRGSQPSPERLDALVRKYHIHTVVNLRGCCDPDRWYLAESRASARLDLSQEDLPFSAVRLPSVPVVRNLVEVLDRSERPILLHCYQGVDRTGMASAMALLLFTDTGLDEALRQLGPRYGHVPLGRTGNIDRFFELYRGWLVETGRPHTPANFRRWVEHEYCPGECRGSVEVLEPAGVPIRMHLGEPLPVRVRCTNLSVKPWHLRPGKGAGVHVFWKLLDANDQGRADGYSGQFYAEVPPGDSIDLTLALPAQEAPGRYRLRVDLVDGQHALFHQLGPDPLEVEVEVR
jgi:hypothetical protein